MESACFLQAVNVAVVQMSFFIEWEFSLTAAVDKEVVFELLFSWRTLTAVHVAVVQMDYFVLWEDSSTFPLCWNAFPTTFHR